MNIEKLLNTIIEAGKMLVESGAEVNRVEETMVRMCRCVEGIEYADSYVTLTGIMFSLTYENKTITRICRVHTGEVDLNRIDQINTLSRSICMNPISVDELANELEKIKKISRYTFKETMFFGAVGAAGFGIFFNGTLLEIVMSFFIGILIRCISCFLSKHKLNSFLNNAISAGSAALSAQLIHQVSLSSPLLNFIRFKVHNSCNLGCHFFKHGACDCISPNSADFCTVNHNVYQHLRVRSRQIAYG